MKKYRQIVNTIIFSIIFLFFFAPNTLDAQEIYKDQSSNKDYLFLGSLQTDQKKWLDLKNNTIKWIKNNQLKQQTGQLTPDEFYKIITSNNLIFYADGSEPHWNATIKKNQLQIVSPETLTQQLDIRITFDPKPLDNVFILMFQSKDNKTYGIIRKLWWDTPCEISISDETSIFEIFINHDGKILKGCVTLDR